MLGYETKKYYLREELGEKKYCKLSQRIYYTDLTSYTYLILGITNKILSLYNYFQYQNFYTDISCQIDVL